MNTQLRKFYEADVGQGGSPTAAQKEARRIVEMFYMVIHNEFVAIKCAIVHVRGIIESKPMLPHEGYFELWQDRADDALSHWQSVLSEIEKM